MASASDSGPVPGQRKRKRQQEVARRQLAARDAVGAGRWEVIFETQDETEWQAYVRRLRAGEIRIDGSVLRVDTLCGRLVQPTTYRLSLFVADPACEPDVGDRDH
jgi:hypothetical protein